MLATASQKRRIAMFLRTTLAALGIAFCIATPTLASDHIEYYNHNGSVMKMVWDEEIGEFFDMFYHRPRAGLNVKRGTHFMSGSYPASGQVSASVKVFKRGCPPAEYEVSGRFDDAGNLHLSGAAPIRKGCTVVGYGGTGSSSLVFTKR
jgi:hypothetical protein